MEMWIILLRSVTFETEKISEIIIKYKMKNSMKNMNLLSALLMGGVLSLGLQYLSNIDIQISEIVKR